MVLSLGFHFSSKKTKKQNCKTHPPNYQIKIIWDYSYNTKNIGQAPTVSNLLSKNSKERLKSAEF